MSELIKLGGYIVSGDNVVQHDNTLSGNGTVDSPLGVVPGYNETVLWSGTDFSKGGGNKLSATVSLSESVQNFDTILIKSSGNLNSENIYVNPAYLGSNGSFQWIALEGNNSTWVGMRGYFTDDTHLKIFGGFSTALPSVFTGGGWWNYKNVYEVVGINRKA